MKKRSLEELGRKSVEEFKGSNKLPVVVVLDNVRSLHNVGSTFRTADAFCLEKIWLTGITGTPPHREIQKTALGATESVAWEYAEDAVALALRLKEEGYTLVAVEQAEGSTLLSDFQPQTGQKYCLVFGNEVFGVNQEIVSASQVCLEIPQEGTKHSLNIAVSLGIVTWEFFRRLYPSGR
jgi:23S rRNA (guanosine2251-2'-O)-methyltransferase